MEMCVEEKKTSWSHLITQQKKYSKSMQHIDHVKKYLVHNLWCHSELTWLLTRPEVGLRAGHLKLDGFPLFQGENCFC